MNDNFSFKNFGFSIVPFHKIINFEIGVQFVQIFIYIDDFHIWLCHIAQSKHFFIFNNPISRFL